MSSSYEPIPTDSDDENDNLSNTALMSDDEAESDRTRSTDRSNFFSQNVPESDDDHTSPVAPASSAPPFSFMGARTIRTARKRVAIPRRRATRSPAAPANDPYLSAFRNAQNWEWIPDTLQRWRHDERLPRTTVEGESSDARPEFPYTWEPPHHTTPILVARLSSQENRIDLIEDALMEMPGMETAEELRYQINNVEERVTGTEDTIEGLRTCLESNTRKLKNMELTMEQMERRLNQCEAMGEVALGFEAYIMKEEYLHKKKSEE